jgi:phosphinothricin acetyltransferase
MHEISVIRSATYEDLKQIQVIYNYYISHTTHTFEEEEISLEELTHRFDTICPKYPWLVMEDRGSISGYAYATGWKPRSAYRHTAETTIYMDSTKTGTGMGLRLYIRLIQELKSKNIHTLLGGISLPNEPSIKLHEKLGFVKVAQLREVGFKFNQWIDVGYWQLHL